tara:strand:+ start:624 stop:1205 length:582 start_codon:yes stop_codon:yes gene_type:complete
MTKNRQNLNRFVAAWFLNLFMFMPSANAAEKISLEYGIFNRTLSIDLLEHLAKTGEAKKPLKNIMRFGNQSPTTLSKLLKEEHDLPLITTSKLMYSSIGEVIIIRVAKIIHPMKIKDNSVSIPAIRSGVINGIVQGNGKLSLIQFLKSYPNKTIAINIPALSKVLNKVETMNELIKFFADSPITGIKKGKASD